MTGPSEREILSGPPEHSLEDDIQDDFEYDPDEQSEAEFWQTVMGEDDDG